MSRKQSWITPFMKQCFVTAGVSLNMLSHGMVVGFSAILLPQLRHPDSSLRADATAESWLASVFGITYMVGNVISSNVMDKFGRKKPSLSSVIIMALGWYMIVWAPNVTSLIVSRTIQGVSLGISGHISPIMLGEYTSPRNRGGLLATISVAISFGVFITHVVGSFLHWRTTALICALFVTLDFFIICFSPETPSWLISQGKYEECKVVFRWLRGQDEEEELKRMIEENMIVKSRKKEAQKMPLTRRFLNKLNYFKITAIKKEFYEPCLVVIHFHVLGQWGGATMLSQFTTDIFHHVIGDGIDVAAMTITLAAHRVISGIYVTIMLEKFKRRTLVILFGAMTLISLVAVASYAYVRPRKLLPFDHPAIGIGLIHLQMVSISTGCISLTYVVAGELFPLQYKALGGALSMAFLSVNVFVVGKTGPYFLEEIGIPVAYCIYAAASTYCVVVIMIFLPETKNKTLQDIEDGFRKRLPTKETITSEPLTAQ